jgi:NitT/TauT family transport system permease protein
MKKNQLLLRVLSPFLAVVIWWLATSVASAQNPILGAMGPVDAVLALGSQAATGSLFNTIGVSLTRLGLGLLIAVVAGLTLGLLIGSVKWFEASTATVVQYLRMVSPLAWAPIAVVLFGIGSPPVVFLVAIAAVWPITLATAAGVKALDPEWLTLAKSLGASRLESVLAIVVPGIRGQVATGVRLALGVAWIVLVPAEMLGVDSGLGYQILNARDQIDYSLLAGVMLLIGAIGFAMDWLTQQLFKRWL